MRFPSWLRPLAARLYRQRSQRAPQRPTLRPRLELLEDRAVPAVIVVTTTDDVVDPNDNVISLREAIQQANADTDADSITFSLPNSMKTAGQDWWTIQPVSVLPDITHTVILDGWSQGGTDYHGAPLVMLDGHKLSGVVGLTIRDFHDVPEDCVIRGLAVGNFEAGIVNGRALRTIVQGCYLGLDPSGNTAAPNREFGIQDGPSTGDTTIGGINAWDRNVISGNVVANVVSASNATIRGNFVGTNVTGNDSLGASSAIGIMGGGTITGNLISGNGDAGIRVTEGSNHVRIFGNKIGTDVSGTKAVGNGGAGIEVRTGVTDLVIGGTESGSCNVISANRGRGISIQSAGVVVQGNYIGTDITGDSLLGNLGGGISTGGSGCRIGGPEPEAENRIAGNLNFGILLGSFNNLVQGNVIHDNVGAGIDIGFGGLGQGNTVTQNSIYHNLDGFFRVGMGIDIRADNSDNGGVTLNDSLGHAGPNRFQNYPDLVSVSRTGGGITVAGSLTQAATPNTCFRIEFFANTEDGHTGPDGSRYGEGKRYLGSVEVETGGDGHADFSKTFTALQAGEGFVTATATNLCTGDTSEFSRAIPVPATQATALAVAPASGVFGGTTTLTATLTAAGGSPLAGKAIAFAIDGTSVGTAVTDGNGVATLSNVSLAALDPGYYPFTASFAGDEGYDPASGSETLTVYYEARTLTDLSRALHAGRAIPIKIQLMDANGNNLSSSDIDLTAIRLERVNADGTRTEVPLQDAGNANPENLFRYDDALGGYLFNLSTKGLGAGTYDFFWTAEGDPTEHSLRFRLT